MSLNTLLPDLPGCSVEQVSKTEEAIFITACATTSSVCCPDCHRASSQVHSMYTRLPKTLPSSGRPLASFAQFERSSGESLSAASCRPKTRFHWG
jgi:hypothetical protein